MRSSVLVFFLLNYSVSDSKKIVILNEKQVLEYSGIKRLLCRMISFHMCKKIILVCKQTKSKCCFFPIEENIFWMKLNLFQGRQVSLSLSITFRSSIVAIFKQLSLSILRNSTNFVFHNSEDKNSMCCVSKSPRWLMFMLTISFWKYLS